MIGRAFQDDIPENYCWGCGRDNPDGLHLRSFWDRESAICDHQPGADKAAGPRDVVNGGIIATLVDCHSVCTAIAAAYRSEGRAIGSDPPIWYVTASLRVSYVKPAPIGAPLRLVARIAEAGTRKTNITCSVSADGVECATGEVLAIRVPQGWGHGRRS